MKHFNVDNVSISYTIQLNTSPYFLKKSRGSFKQQNVFKHAHIKGVINNIIFLQIVHF